MGVSGIGKLSNNGQVRPRILQRLNVTIFGRENCGNIGRLPEDQLCAGVMEGGRSHCHGDSGGPLVASGKNNNGAATLFGVASRVAGPYCDAPQYPGIYTDVPHFLNQEWVKNALKGGITCQAPSSPAPSTDSPVNPAPETPGPHTLAPETPAPSTQAPETSSSSDPISDIAKLCQDKDILRQPFFAFLCRHPCIAQQALSPVMQRICLTLSKGYLLVNRKVGVYASEHSTDGVFIYRIFSSQYILCIFAHTEYANLCTM